MNFLCRSRLYSKLNLKKKVNDIQKNQNCFIAYLKFYTSVNKFNDF